MKQQVSQVLEKRKSTSITKKNNRIMIHIHRHHSLERKRNN